MLKVVEKKGQVERTVKLIRPSTSSEVAVYGNRKAQPNEDPSLTRRLTAEDSREKEAKSTVASSPVEWFPLRIFHTGSGKLAPLSTD